MTELLGGVLAIAGLGALLVFIVRGPEGVRQLAGGLLGRRNESWAGGVPARLLLIVTAVMFALETGIAAGRAGSGLATLLILGSAALLAVAPNIAGLVLGILGLLWAVPKMIDDVGASAVFPILALSLLAAALAGVLSRD
ncbi:MAG: hypothetical protein WCF36_19530 [Candidatus Nanopelagicales bacterium]